MKSPKRNEFVEVVDNKTGEIIGRGYLKGYMPNHITIEQTFDAKTVHFKGYKPRVKESKNDK